MVCPVIVGVGAAPFVETQTVVKTAGGHGVEKALGHEGVGGGEEAGEAGGIEKPVGVRVRGDDLAVGGRRVCVWGGRCLEGG